MLRVLNSTIRLMGACAMFFLMMITVVDVFARNVLNSPLPGADELAELALGCIVFLLLPAITYKRGHIAVDLVGRRSDGALRMVLEVAAAVIGCAVFLLIGWRLAYLAMNAQKYGDATPSLHIPMAPMFYLIAFLAIVSAGASLATIPSAIRAAYPRTVTPEHAKADQ